MIDLIKVGEEKISHRRHRSKQFTKWADDITGYQGDCEGSQQIREENSGSEDMVERAIRQSKCLVSQPEKQETYRYSGEGIDAVQFLFQTGPL